MSSTQALESLVPSLQSPVCWADEDHTMLVCTAVSDVTHDVKNFVFEAEGDQRIRRGQRRGGGLCHGHSGLP